MKRAIVTGGAGFIGSYVVRELLTHNYDVVVIDNFSNGKRENIPENVTVVEADICDYEKIFQTIQEGDTIFHLAALTSVPLSIENPLPYHTTNIQGTYTVLEVARIKKASGFIFSSSAAVYGSQEGTMSETVHPMPESPYALHKLIGEQLCESYSTLYGIPTVCLRYFNVYGKGCPEVGSYAPVIARFLKAKRESKPLPVVEDGSHTRDFVHVNDVARANVQVVSLLTPHYFGIINVCTGISSSVIDIAHMVGGDIEHLPPRAGIKHSLGDPSKLHTILDKKTIRNPKEGIQELIDGLSQ